MKRYWLELMVILFLGFAIGANWAFFMLSKLAGDLSAFGPNVGISGSLIYLGSLVGGILGILTAAILSGLVYLLTKLIRKNFTTN